jgi:inhibitor of KinA
MYGFSPGFFYLKGLPDLLILSRKKRPSSSIPAGSLAIAVGYTGIYPRALPGGWYTIGRTPLRLFKPETSVVFPIEVGQCVRFKSISKDDFDHLNEYDRSN